MNKRILLILISAVFLSASSCYKENVETNVLPNPEKSNYEKALLTISEFDIENTNGFDFSLKQYLGKDEINYDIISLRADFSNDVKECKEEESKKLNGYYEKGEQYTFSKNITYYSNNMICENKNDEWEWSNCKKSTFFENSISRMNFDKSFFTSVKESYNGQYVFSANVIEEKTKDFMNVDENDFSGMSIKLFVSSDFNELESVELSYFQKYTRTEMKFSIYRGNVEIVLPD